MIHQWILLDPYSTPKLLGFNSLILVVSFQFKYSPKIFVFFPDMDPRHFSNSASSVIALWHENQTHSLTHWVPNSFHGYLNQQSAKTWVGVTCCWQNDTFCRSPDGLGTDIFLCTWLYDIIYDIICNFKRMSMNINKTREAPFLIVYI